MNAHTVSMKTVHFAYPSSDVWNKFGRPLGGCWYTERITVDTTVDRWKWDFKPLNKYATRGEAFAAAAMMPEPWEPCCARVNKHAIALAEGAVTIHAV